MQLSRASLPAQDWHALWHRSLDDPSLWRALSLGNSQAPGRALRYAASQPRLLASIQELHLEFAAGVTDALLLPLAVAALEALNLNGCQKCAPPAGAPPAARRRAARRPAARRKPVPPEPCCQQIHVPCLQPAAQPVCSARAREQRATRLRPPGSQTRPSRRWRGRRCAAWSCTGT